MKKLSKNNHKTNMDIKINKTSITLFPLKRRELLYFRLIAGIGPLRTLTFTFLIPPFAVLWGYLALGETISQGFILGGIIVCISVWLVVSPDKKAAAIKG